MAHWVEACINRETTGQVKVVADAELLALMTKDPSKYSFSSLGAGSVARLAMETLSSRVGANRLRARGHLRIGAGGQVPHLVAAASFEHRSKLTLQFDHELPLPLHCRHWRRNAGRH